MSGGTTQPEIAVIPTYIYLSHYTTDVEASFCEVSAPQPPKRTAFPLIVLCRISRVQSLPNELALSPILSVLHPSTLLQNLCIEFVDFGQVETMAEILKQDGLQEMIWINDVPAVHLKGFCNLTSLELYSLYGSETHLTKDIRKIHIF